ncbi:MAG: RluA family pseudouridine synthase, partial [Actinomycetota bacterium]|nr:RluA family pseudouridine synthase [Actinomycetota bacterium]
ARYPEVASVGPALRPGIVHRLDRGTSGLLMVARTATAHAALARQLSDRRVDRRYLALVHGCVEADEGRIEAPIGRSPRGRTRMAVVVGGREARTAYTVRGRWERPGTTLLECRLETGRTHQIRVHLTAIGHPLVGDAAYDSSRDHHGLGRPFLHAAHLGFVHPSSGAEMAFDSSLPADLSTVLAGLAHPLV